MHTDDIEYEHGGRRLVGHLAEPDGTDARPTVLVCHEGPGLDDHAKTVAVRLAQLGYLAFALDYHGDGKPLERNEMMGRLGALMTSPGDTRALARAGLAVLLAQPRADASRVAAIGYCFGGTMALELARDGADLRAVVGFHSGLGTSRPDDAANIRARVLVCIGSEDPFVPPDQRLAFEAEMRAGKVDWRMHLHGGVAHSFTNERASEAALPGVAYDQRTDERSWRAMLDLFDEAFI